MVPLLGFFPTDTADRERKRLKTSPRFAPVEEEIRSSNPEPHASPFSVRIKQPNPVAFLFRASSWVAYLYGYPNVEKKDALAS